MNNGHDGTKIYTTLPVMLEGKRRKISNTLTNISHSKEARELTQILDQSILELESPLGDGQELKH